MQTQTGYHTKLSQIPSSTVPVLVLYLGTKIIDILPYTQSYKSLPELQSHICYYNNVKYCDCSHADAE